MSLIASERKIKKVAREKLVSKQLAATENTMLLYGRDGQDAEVCSMLNDGQSGILWLSVSVNTEELLNENIQTIWAALRTSMRR